MYGDRYTVERPLFGGWLYCGSFADLDDAKNHANKVRKKAQVIDTRGSNEDREIIKVVYKTGSK